MPHSLSNTWAKYYKDCEEQPDEELAGRIVNHGSDASKMKIAQFVYEMRQMNRQQAIAKEQLELQHKLNKENIELQHTLNDQIVSKQLRLMKITTFVTASSTLIAALAGAYLAFALTQTQRPIQIKLDSGLR